MNFCKRIKNEISTRQLDSHLLSIRHAGENFSHEPNIKVALLENAEVREFCAGVFLATAHCGFVPGKSGSGYHIEFVFASRNNAQDFCEILASYDILPRLTNRGNDIIIYIKSADCVCNLLALIGATSALMEINNEIVVREVRNRANRRVNCDTHNISRQIETSARQIKIIKKLLENGAINEPKLLATAHARVSNPNLGYDELASQLSLTKSGLANRLRKILALANSK